jgi:hypothetical protein
MAADVYTNPLNEESFPEMMQTRRGRRQRKATAASAEPSPASEP